MKIDFLKIVKFCICSNLSWVTSQNVIKIYYSNEGTKNRLRTYLILHDQEVYYEDCGEDSAFFVKFSEGEIRHYTNEIKNLKFFSSINVSLHKATTYPHIRIDLFYILEPEIRSTDGGFQQKNLLEISSMVDKLKKIVPNDWWIYTRKTFIIIQPKY